MQLQEPPPPNHLLCVQGYLFLLLSREASLLGLGYLALLIAILVSPPLRGRYVERDDMGRPVTGAASAVTQIYRHGVCVMGGAQFLECPCLPFTQNDIAESLV